MAHPVGAGQTKEHHMNSISHLVVPTVEQRAKRSPVDYLVEQTLGWLGSREIHHPDYWGIVIAVRKVAQLDSGTACGFIERSAIHVLAGRFNVREG